MKIVYLVESGRDDPEFEALLSSKQAALDMLAANRPEYHYGNDWIVRAIEVDGEEVGSAHWTCDWMAEVREWRLEDNLP